ncbi:MAG: type I secretion system permease/ATPase [Altererythrobacter sp.]|nr:type I secretion system permease/ATPase [Altererythrobacter sp.]|tara:strand:- start:3730 stop:6009 length:2280 start_codon:yes stop_codon:yes gene_type:complete
MTRWSDSPSPAQAHIPAQPETDEGADTKGHIQDKMIAGWREAVLRIAGHYQLNASPEHLRLSAQWIEDRDIAEQAAEMARQVGLSFKWVRPRLEDLNPWRLPVIIQLDDGEVAVVTSMTDDALTLALDDGSQGEVSYDIASLASRAEAMAIARPLRGSRDARIDNYIKPVQKHWLRKLVLVDWRPFAHIFVASLVTNLMALAGVLFSMQVYDRVVPAQSMPTLYVLSGGVLIAIIFAWVMRNARMRITDLLGKRADLRISDLVFGRALRIKNSARPKSTGTFISQIRELEPVRDMLTSTTIAAAADLPFFLLFCVIFWMIAGWLVVVPIAAFALLIIPSLLAQPRLRELAQTGMREASLRNAMLVEAVQGIDDIKVLQAEQRFQNQWNHYNEVNADSALSLRDLLNRLNNWMQTVQGAAFAVVIFLGAPQVMNAEMSTGVLVAASILVSRMLAPLSSITTVLNRWQQARVATEALDQLMQQPVDDPIDGGFVHRPNLGGRFTFKDAKFSYDGETTALAISKLEIVEGERVAVLGRNGAGKSTLLNALSGLMQPASGSVLLDGLEMGHIDPADVRRDVCLLNQQAQLFHGTLRENLKLGAPLVTDERVVEALETAGIWPSIQKLPLGLDHHLQEGGRGLSGGQRQGILLARILLREPRTLLLDEPTAAMDELTEAHIIGAMKAMSRDRTVIIATHRLALLDVVERLVIVDGGVIAMDGPKDAVLAQLRREDNPTSMSKSAAPAVGRRIVVRPKISEDKSD